MAKGSNTWCKKLMAKQKRHWQRSRLGTCDRLSPRGFNHGMQFGIVDKPVEPGKIVTGDADRNHVYRPFKGRTFGKWKHYA